MDIYNKHVLTHLGICVINYENSCVCLWLVLKVFFLVAIIIIHVHVYFMKFFSIYFRCVLQIGTEDLVSAYCYKYSFKAVGLRFFSVYGPWGRPDGDIYAMATLIDKGEQVYVYRNNE